MRAEAPTNPGSHRRIVKTAVRHPVGGPGGWTERQSLARVMAFPGGPPGRPRGIPTLATPPDVLVTFVRSCLERGITRADVARALESAGWQPREARAALEAFAESPLPVPVPRKRVSSSLRDAFQHLLAVFSLYNAAVATGAILFSLVERWLPLPTDSGLYVAGVLRWAAATLIVTLPILGLVRRAIGREQARNPLSRVTPAYRALAYFTLLATSVVMAGDLICVLIGFMQGDTTLRFLIKAAIVLGIAGGIFLWFSSDLRREESLGESSAADPALLPPAPPWRDWLHRCGFALAVASLVAALVLVGSPVRARLLRLDADRVDDLREIRVAVENYHQRHGRLPETLTELQGDPGTYVGDLEDPVTGEPYGYRPLEGRSYELAASFDAATPPRGDRVDFEGDTFFSHEPGRQTFTITVPERTD